MKLTTWKALLSLVLGAIISIIGISVWALENNNYDLTRIGLLVLLALCIIGSTWIIIALTAVFKTIEHTLLSVDEIKKGLQEAQTLLREYEEAQGDYIIELSNTEDQIEEFLSDDIH